MNSCIESSVEWQEEQRNKWMQGEQPEYAVLGTTRCILWQQEFQRNFVHFNTDRAVYFIVALFVGEACEKSGTFVTYKSIQTSDKYNCKMKKILL